MTGYANLLMDTIKYYETEIGKIHMGNKLGSLFSEKFSAATGDGRRKEVKQAKKDLDHLIEGLKQLQNRHYMVTGDGDLDLL